MREGKQVSDGDSGAAAERVADKGEKGKERRDGMGEWKASSGGTEGSRSRKARGRERGKKGKVA